MKRKECFHNKKLALYSQNYNDNLLVYSWHRMVFIQNFV